MTMTSPDGRTYEFPTTPTQASLWFINQMDPARTAYNIPASFELRGRLDAGALRASLEELVQRHEILRTVFVSRGGEVFQRVLPRLDLDWAQEERPESAERAELIGLAELEVRRTFDLASGPLLRVRLWSFGVEHHLLTFVFHHIVIDHVSLGQFSSELTQLYEARSTGAEAPLPELELQFADYAIWFLEQAVPAAKAVGLPYWTDALNGFSGTLDLPIDNPRTAAGACGAEMRFRLPADLSSRVREFARGEGLSVFNVTLGALQILLHHYTGQDDIIVGTPFANRGGDERLDAVMGCFLNTLPIGIRIDPDAGFRAALNSARSALLKAHQHQAVPFDAIVHALTPHREFGLNPLYQVGFVFQEPPIAIQLRGVETTSLAVHSGGAMYDLHIWLWEADGAIEGTVWYDASLFGEAKVQRLVDRYVALTDRLIATPEAAVGDLSIETDADTGLTAEVNATDVQWDGPETVVDLVRAQAARTPDRQALVTNERAFSYAELVERADEFAGRLQAGGVGAGDLVGVYLERGPGMLPALLAVQSLGAAYVPMDPDYPASRLGFIAEAADLRALISDDDDPDVDLPPGCQVLVLDAEGESARFEPGSVQSSTADSTIYVIFTSGSTGHPKGVSVPQRCVVNLLRSMASLPGLDDGPTLLAVTTLSFDIAVLELFLPLTNGGTVVLADAVQALDGDDLGELLEEHAVTAMQATPSTWRLLLDSGWESESLTALCGGEALPPDLARMLRERVKTLWNVYGPTETTVWSTRDRVDDDRITIGRPIANTTCHVQSRRGVPLPSDIAGELLIGGRGVTDGYHHRPDLTEERFIRNPLGDGRLYCTGDIVRRLADGRLEYLGRLDDQVKVNGHRIELGEVEGALNSHPSVRQAVAAVQRGQSGDARLAAFVVPNEGAQIVGSEIRRHARRKLPDYMVPGMVQELALVPRTPNGKIDRKSLAASASEMITSRTKEPPETAEEQVIADIWSDALGVASVSRHDNFFELGGHSLLALRVAAEIRSRLDRDLEPRSLFFSSLSQLAGAMD
jgi:amino acid adenylation domain-containing protein